MLLGDHTEACVASVVDAQRLIAKLQPVAQTCEEHLQVQLLQMDLKFKRLVYRCAYGVDVDRSR